MDLGISYNRGWILIYFELKSVKHYNKDMLNQARVKGYSDGSKVNLHHAIDPNETKKIFLS